MDWQLTSQKIHDHLRGSATRKRLNERFASARNQLTTTIGEAAKLAHVSPEKARYAEMIGILSPGRSRESKGGAHRRYSLRELNRLVVMGDLIDHGFSMADIAHYLTHERSATDIILDSLQAPDLAARLRDAESAYLQRMLIPRLLYFAQCLLLGDVVDGSIALVLPVAADFDEARPNILVTRADELPLAGPSLIGWHSRSHPYCVLYMREPRMDDATRYELRSVDEMCREAGVADAANHPTGAYLLIEPEFAHLLYTTPAAYARPDAETPAGDTERDTAPNSRAVAYRLLRFLQAPRDADGDETEGKDKDKDKDDGADTFGARYSSLGEGMVYSSPEFMSDMTGDRLLTEIAELIVRLGNAASVPTSSRRGRWIFSAILMPDNLYLPPGQQSLVVMAQSAKSPHTVGVSQVTPGKNEGLSTLAALSGHMLLRRAIESTDAAVADGGFEDAPGPTLALPVLGPYGRVLAVLYVRSRYEENTATQETFTADDQVLLRIIGHIVGGIVSGYRGNYLARDVLAEMMKQPRTIDRFFQEFKSANAFWADLAKSLERQKPAKDARKAAATSASAAANPISLIAIDIDGHSTIFNEYGDNTARNLIRAMGRRIADQPLLTNSPLMSASDRTRKRVYHIYGDRFCLLLENVARDDAEVYAANLRDLLSGDYALEVSRTAAGHDVPVTKFMISDVRVRIALISYDHDTLRKLLVPVTTDDHTTLDHAHEPVQYVISVITNALDAGLNQAKQIGPGTIMYLDTSRSLFRKLQVDVDQDEPRAADERRSSAKPANGVSSPRNHRNTDAYRR